MSKLAHSNQETMDQIERDADDLPEPPSWYCEPCAVIAIGVSPHQPSTNAKSTRGAAMKRFYFQGYRGVGTWLLAVTIESTDAFNAVLQAHKGGWHHLRLMAIACVEQPEGRGR